jgi:hypothetical protein
VEPVAALRRTTVPVRLAIAVSVAASACSGVDEITTPTADVPETVAMGVLPEPLTGTPTLPPPPSPPTTAPATAEAVPDEPIELPLTDHVDDDRILFIGDGTIASALPPGDRQLCDALSVFGWNVEIDAFAGVDDLSYVSAVLDLRLRPDDDLDWDAIALWVGNELPPDGLAVEELEATLDATIERAAPRPVVLYTLTELGELRVPFNEVIRSRAEEHTNVAVIDWAELAGDADEVLEDDAVTLASDGLKRLPLITAQALGEAPGDPIGGCDVGVDTET